MIDEYATLRDNLRQGSRSMFRSPVVLVTGGILLVFSLLVMTQRQAIRANYAANVVIPIATTETSQSSTCEDGWDRLFIDWVGYSQPNAFTELYMECNDGRIINLSNTRYRENNPIASPNGQLIAYDRTDIGRPAQVWVMNIDGSEQRQITFNVIGANVIEWVSDTELQYKRRTMESCVIYQNDIVASNERIIKSCEN